MTQQNFHTGRFDVERCRFRDEFQAHAVEVERRRRIAAQGDPAEAMLWVATGWVALSKGLKDGKAGIIDICLPGDLVIVAGPDGRHSNYDIETLTAARVALIDLTDIDAWRNGSPSAAGHLARMHALIDARRAERMLRLAHGSALMRVAYVLIEFHLRIDGADHFELNSFHIPLTQQHIGDLTGLTSVHVSRTFRALGESGLVRYTDHFDIRIEDLDGLCEVADVDLNALRAVIAPAA